MLGAENGRRMGIVGPVNVVNLRFSLDTACCSLFNGDGSAAAAALPRRRDLGSQSRPRDGLAEKPVGRCSRRAQRQSTVRREAGLLVKSRIYAPGNPLNGQDLVEIIRECLTL